MENLDPKMIILTGPTCQLRNLDRYRFPSLLCHIYSAGLTTRYRKKSLYKSIFVLPRPSDIVYDRIESLLLKIAGIKFEL